MLVNAAILNDLCSLAPAVAAVHLEIGLILLASVILRHCYLASASTNIIKGLVTSGVGQAPVHTALLSRRIFVRAFFLSHVDIKSAICKLFKSRKGEMYLAFNGNGCRYLRALSPPSVHSDQLSVLTEYLSSDCKQM